MFADALLLPAVTVVVSTVPGAALCHEEVTSSETEPGASDAAVHSM